MLKKIGYVLMLFLIAGMLASCGGGRKAVQIKGSDTMVNLAQAWAEAFMKENPEVAIAVTGGGSGVGIAALISGTTDIAQASRNMEPKEIELARKKGVEPKEFHVANDGVTIVVHPSNPVSRLTLRQLSDIYTGRIKNWKEVGGKDERIVALSRDRNSGTHVFFLEHVIKLGDKKNTNEFAPGILMMPSNQAIVDEVSGNPSALGYIGLGYLTDRQKALAVSRGAAMPYVVPSVKTVVSGQYPVSRSLLFYTDGEPAEKVKTLIDFVLSEKGQEIVLKMDFVPVK
jgi:phosphate transport system substrate-binding protein